MTPAPQRPAAIRISNPLSRTIPGASARDTCRTSRDRAHELVVRQRCRDPPRTTGAFAVRRLCRAARTSRCCAARTDVYVPAAVQHQHGLRDARQRSCRPVLPAVRPCEAHAAAHQHCGAEALLDARESAPWSASRSCRRTSRASRQVDVFPRGQVVERAAELLSGMAQRVRSCDRPAHRLSRRAAASSVRRSRRTRPRRARGRIS